MTVLKSLSLLLKFLLLSTWIYNVSAFHSVANYPISKFGIHGDNHPRRKTLPSTALSMLTLYGSPGSRSPLIDWAAYELDLPFSRAPDLSTNPHPFKQIPCLVDGEEVIFESGAILIHLFHLALKKNEVNDKQQASIISWIVWANASLDPICFLETPDGKVYDTGLKKPNRRIDTIDQLLSSQAYMTGDNFTIADVAIASYLLYVPQFFQDIDLSRWPNVVRYMQDCANREMYGKAFGKPVQNFLLQKLEIMAQSSGSSDKENKLFGLF